MSTFALPTASEVAARAVAWEKNPLTPETFIAAWGPKLVTTIRSFGIINPEDVSDAYQHLMLKWFEGDYLAAYDPKKGAFSTFFYGFARLRLQGMRRNLAIRYTRNDIVDILDWSGIGDELPEIEADADVDAIHTKLAALKVRGKRDLARLFRDLQTQIAANGSKNQSALAAAYGVSPAAVTTQMGDLRDILVYFGVVAQDSRGVWQWTDTVDFLTTGPDVA